MPGQIGSSNSRKRKRSSAVKSSRKVSAARRCMKSSEGPSLGSGHSKAASPLRTSSRISCECHQASSRKRCSASPDLEGQEGKENELRTRPDRDHCGSADAQDKQGCGEVMDYKDNDRNLFPDDDSNQILPIEQFFGNLDVVQDLPQGSSSTSARNQRENRRRYFYAREDSDDEDVSRTWPDDTGSNQ